MCFNLTFRHGSARDESNFSGLDLAKSTEHFFKCSLLTVRVSPPTNNLALFAGELLR